MIEIRGQENSLEETMTQFSDRLAVAVKRCGTPVLVGLDPRFQNLPIGLTRDVAPTDAQAVAKTYTRFCCDVIDVVAERVAVVKPQAAFFELLGPPGMEALRDVIAYARQKELLVLIDAKRNDIGSTARAYAEAYLGDSPPSSWGGHALTVSPYLGGDSLEPFFEIAIHREAGVFVLVKTSNPGGALFQDLHADHHPLYEHVALYVQHWAARTAGAAGYGAVGAVVGATYPQQQAALREQMPNAWFLVPGFGAQGARASDVKGAFAADGLGALVNSSRGIIFAHSRPEYRDRFGERQWQEAVDAATRDMIEQLRSETPAGRLSGSYP
ncbi:MAG: orotidine-5'-phosphate decarboxylase [Planctomycetota bacterium]